MGVFMFRNLEEVHAQVCWGNKDITSLLLPKSMDSIFSIVCETFAKRRYTSFSRALISPFKGSV